MPFTKKAFGEKLSSLRTDFGLDPDSLARECNISANRIGLLEKGIEAPTGDEVLILSEYFKRDFRYLINDDETDIDCEIDILFREHGGALSTHDRIAIAEFIYLCRCQAFLESDLGFQKADPPFRFTPKGNFFKAHGRQCASELRRYLSLGNREVPRDIFQTIRGLGIKVFRRKLQNSQISGLFVNHPLAGRCILVNLAEGTARERFSAAHELGHAILDGKPLTFSTIGEWNSNTLVEVRANTFASDLLIPPSLLNSIDQQKWLDPKFISSWAENLRVSIPALISALVAVGSIDHSQREALRQSAKRPPSPIDPELEGLSGQPLARKMVLLERGLSKPYVHLCFDAYTRDRISFGLLADMLLVDPVEVREVATLFGRSLPYA